MPHRKSPIPAQSLPGADSRTADVLPAPLTQRLLEAMAGTSSASAADVVVQARVRRALMQRIDGTTPAPTAMRTVRCADGTWQRWFRGVERMVVDESGPTHIWLLKVAPGASMPAHDHDHGDEESFILSGSCRLNGELLHAGDYHHAPKGSRHDQLVSEEGCVLWLRMPASQARAMMVPG
jgi:anti-sigma factor ChrR (cupin superfamily)